MKNTVIIAALLMCSGCVASYTHISNPRVSNDGYDLVCGELEKQFENSLSLRGGVCKDVSGYKEEYARFGVEYRFGRLTER